jgi:hypothetical protein
MKKPLPPRLEDVNPENLLRIGGPVDRVKISLRIFGDELDPEKITGLLGCKATLARRKGDLIPNKRYQLVAKTGSWILKGDVPETENPDTQIVALLDRVTENPEVWKSLVSQFKVDIFCGVFLDAMNRGFPLSAKTISALAERGLEIGFDIYCP